MESFSYADLTSLPGDGVFCWKWLPASGHSGGILLGARLDVFYFVSFDSGSYFASMVLYHRALDINWEFIGVYGPANHSLSHAFLLELASKIESISLPFLIGGDFNLLRFPWDKNNDNFSWSRAEGFNDFIINFALRELHRSGARFT